MSGRPLGHRLTCDSCGAEYDCDRACADNPALIASSAQVWQSASGARWQASLAGWIVTTPADVAGQWERIEYGPGKQRRQPRLRLFDICGECADSWSPPMSEAAKAAVDAYARSTPPDVSSVLAGLVAENARLRAAAAQS